MEIEIAQSNDKLYIPSLFLKNLIQTLEIKNLSPEISSEHPNKYSLIQIIHFINLLNSNHYFEDIFNSPFYFPLMQMKKEPKYKDLINQSFLDSKLSLIKLKKSGAFINKTISHNLARKLKVCIFQFFIIF